MTEMTLPDYNDVAAAAERIADYANKTPVMTSRTVIPPIAVHPAIDKFIKLLTIP